MRIAVLASGNGSNFAAIADYFQKESVAAEIAFVFSDKKNAFVLERAQKIGVATFQFSPQDFPSKKDYEKALLALMQQEKIDLIVLAGYMRIIGPQLLAAFPKKIINIHPSLLPAFPGLNGIKDAYDYGVKVTGVTVHYIDAGVDTGPIIAQVPVLILDDDLTSLEAKIHQAEHQLYPTVLKQIVQGQQ
ncbi:phosphoribosylglycinamide formyltransferase [Enterococcus montenegrensis]|uniref:phosphoribosylglycinamide formyltransferase n=1 Tax=Enterococcus montenegrensis TaxID=3031993 RepID=UPI00249DDB68|nr:phosphoribosylglycinamide formyltransferase [Enterococcus montenegrensis]WHA10305.1 phosphoribosylglycinamide formyltransferase [Enterococcus montenegrensis]